MTSRLLLLFLSASVSWIASAQSYSIVEEGSVLASRSLTDKGLGQVYIYTGGTLPIGTHLVTLHFQFDNATNGSNGYMTPLLFEQTSPGIYTVIGIGTGFDVATSSEHQKIPFTITAGVGVPTNAQCTFGYINALLDSNGVPLMTSTGTVDYGSVYTGEGTGGAGTTNEWEDTATGLTGPEVVTLGTTFGASGADYPFYGPRTYSATALGVLAQ